MAETVKKSRIVSDDDNLEESLLEEFNMRLKNCMSQDNIKNEEDEEGDDDNIIENSMYGNVEAIKITQQIPNSGLSSSDFIQSEIEHYYEEPKVIKNGGEIVELVASQENGHAVSDNVADNVEDLYENVAQTNKTETNDQYIDMSPQDNVENAVQPTIALESNDYEEMAEVVKPVLNLPTTSLTESENVSPMSDQNDAKSVKDRMFLSTDDTSCLLFTQTVTSPMLTPSEENIDFLKGFQTRESTVTSSETTNNSSESPKNEKSNAESTDVDISISGEAEQVVTDLDEAEPSAKKEIIYENLPNGKVCDEVIYENLKPKAYEEPVYQNIQEVLSTKTTEQPEDKQPKIVQEPSATLPPQQSEEDANRNRDSLREFEKLEKDLESLVNLGASTEKPEEEEIEESTATTTEEKSSSVVIKSEVKEKYSEFIHHNRIETSQNYLEKYSEVVSKNNKNIENKEKDTETVPDKIVQNLMSQFSKSNTELVVTKKEFTQVSKIKNVDIMKQINKFESQKTQESEDSTVTESYSETTTIEEMGQIGDKGMKKKKSKKSRKEEKENISVNESDENSENFYNVNVKNLKSSFNKFDALQKKNVLHVRSSDATGAQDKFNGNQIDTTNCKACSKTVFQMEQIKAEKAIWHKNCFRCTECNKQLNVDTYQSHEGTLYCKPHFKTLFAPKAVEEDQNAPSDKPDLGLEELQSLNVKERFQVFEHHQTESYESESNREPVNVKRSPSILSKLARFQAKGMDVGVADDSLNGIPIEESESEEEIEEEIDGEDADLVRAKRVQKEKPFHFTGMSDVKNKWEKGEQNGRDERREERKQEIQSIRNRLFMGKQGKMKEMYQQAVAESETTNKSKVSEKIDFDAKSIKDKFEKGEMTNEKIQRERDEDEEEVYESEISKKSRSLFLELDANASKPPQLSPVTPPKTDIKKAREAYLNKVASEDTVKSSEVIDDIEVKTADIQQRFKFFETYKEPEQAKKQFRITPPREGQVKAPTPEREVYRDPEVVRSEEIVEDSVVAKESHTATKMLNKFRQMEENLSKDNAPQGPKPLKRFTPPPEPTRPESSSEAESGSEEESEQEDDVDNTKMPSDLLEAQKAARAKHLRAKFEKWEAQEIRKEQTNSVSVIEEYGEEQSQVESTKSLRARFENMRESTNEGRTQPRVKVNRFVEISNGQHEMCQSCKMKVYPLEKISVHGQIFHKQCFKCMECNCVLRMDSYTYNQGLLYCIPHFKRLFIAKGNYESGFGLDQHKDKWNPSHNTATMA